MIAATVWSWLREKWTPWAPREANGVGVRLVSRPVASNSVLGHSVVSADGASEAASRGSGSERPGLFGSTELIDVTLQPVHRACQLEDQGLGGDVGVAGHIKRWSVVGSRHELSAERVQPAGEIGDLI